MISPYQFWIDLGNLLLDPKKLLFGMFELFFSWLHTRSWISLLFGLPLALLIAFMLGSKFYIDWLGPTKLLESYWKVIEQDSPASAKIQLREQLESVASNVELQKGVAENETDISLFASSLLLKVKSIDDSNSRANYFVASTLAKQGRLSQARQLMRRIAPTNESGFAPAHAWLATDRLKFLKVKEQKDLVVLRFDLVEAMRWSGVEPLLMNAYADILLGENSVDEAVSILRSASRKDSRLLLRLFAIAKQRENSLLMESLVQEIEGPRQERKQKGEATELDFIELASLQLMKQDLDQAVATIQAGIKQFADSAQLKRLLSQAYLAASEKAAKINDNISRLDLLDRAMKSDPGNPGVQEKIAELTVEGKVTNENIASFLRDELAAGRATALTHLLLAIGHLRKDEMEKAMVHLELAHSLAPRNPVILNNLALCLARTKPDELPRAKKMIEVALVVAGPYPELLDTYGEVLMLASDFVGAIRAFEAALSNNQERPETRKKLADAYTKVALHDMAESVKKAGASTSPALGDPLLLNSPDETQRLPTLLDK